MRAVAIEEILAATPGVEDRRLHKRIRVRKAILVRILDKENEEESATLTDLSRDGVYFKVRAEGYQVGMDIQLKIPASGFQCVCNIVRVERLPNKVIGVAGVIVGW